MPQVKFAVDPWSQEAFAAWDEFYERFHPSFLRMVRAQNTPNEALAKFEHEAILKEARRLYHIRLGFVDA